MRAPRPSANHTGRAWELGTATRKAKERKGNKPAAQGMLKVKTIQIEGQ